MSTNETTRWLDRRLAAPMFIASLAVLALFAILLHLHELEQGRTVVLWCLGALAVLYPLFWIETIAHSLAGSRRMRQHFWFCLIPFLRIGCRDHETGKQIWLPHVGWRTIDRPFEKKLIRAASGPMIVVALLVLPVIMLEFFWADFVATHEHWRVSLQITAAFIWAAFTFEFTLLISVVKYPMAYARRHWIDAAIILLPMVTFIRAARLTQLARMKQITRAARVYRLRGLAMRMWRGLVALEIVEMVLLRDPERRMEKLESQLEFRLEEIEFLRQDIQRLQKRVEEKLARQQQTPASPSSGTTPESRAPSDDGKEPDRNDPDPDGPRVRRTA